MLLSWVLPARNQTLHQLKSHCSLWCHPSRRESLGLWEQQLQRGEEGVAVGIVHLVRSLCWPGGVGVGPESSAGRVCVGVAFWGNTSSPNFAKWSIFPKAAPLFAAKTVLSPPDTQHFPGWINGQLFQKHVELPPPASLLLLSHVFVGVFLKFYFNL